MKVIGLVPNPHKSDSMLLAAEFIEWLDGQGIRAVVTEDVAAHLNKPHLGVTEDEVIAADFLLVLGGDGTMLRWARLAAPKGTPLMGVNFGQYGFITEIHPNEAKSALSQVIAGNYCTSERVMLKATVTRDDNLIGTYYALNDAVVSKGAFARMLGLHTYVNNRFIVTYTADGIIVSSPTGSTAYSLSAGGPVVHPDVSVLIVTPICPHTLNARSLVIPDDETIQIIGEGGVEQSSMMLTIDGQVGEQLMFGDKVEIGKSEYKAKLVQVEPQSFYNKLQKRLRWGERFSGQ